MNKKILVFLSFMSVGLVATDSGPGPDILMRRYFAIRHRAPGLRNNGLVIGVREDNSIALLELIEGGAIFAPPAFDSVSGSIEFSPDENAFIFKDPEIEIDYAKSIRCYLKELLGGEESLRQLAGGAIGVPLSCCEGQPDYHWNYE